MNQWNDESNQCNIESSLNWTLWDNESRRSSKWTTLITSMARSKVKIPRPNWMVIWVDVGCLWKCEVLFFHSTLHFERNWKFGYRTKIFSTPTTSSFVDLSVSEAVHLRSLRPPILLKLEGQMKKIPTSTFSKIVHSHSNDHPVWSMNFY